MADSTATSQRTTRLNHFRLRDLPDESQIKIYQKYFEGSQLILEDYDRVTGKLKFTGIPSLDLELDSHDVHIEAKKARNQMTGDTLAVVHKRIFLDGSLAEFLSDSRYFWVRGHIRMLQIQATYSSSFISEVGWKLAVLISRCAQLREIDIRLTRLRSCSVTMSVLQEPDILSYTRTKSLVQYAMRYAMAYGQTLVVSVLDLVRLKYLCTLLAQRSTEYKVTLHDMTMYCNCLDGAAFFTDVSLRKGVHAMRFG